MTITPDSAPSHHDHHQARTYERRWWVLAVLSASVFLVVVDNLIVNVALPTLQRELHATVTSLQWIVDAYSLVFACLLLAGGSIGDRFGRKRIMALSILVYSVSPFCAAYATSLGMFIFFRCTTFIGVCVEFVAAVAWWLVWTTLTGLAAWLVSFLAVNWLLTSLGPGAGWAGFLASIALMAALPEATAPP